MKNTIKVEICSIGDAVINIAANHGMIARWLVAGEFDLADNLYIHIVKSSTHVKQFKKEIGRQFGNIFTVKYLIEVKA